MKQRPQNILLITSDQQHWNTIGKNFPEIKTPNLDRLANQGFLARRAYCSNPTCTPTRATLLTGQYASRHGAWSLGTKLPEDARTIGHLLGEAGYDTALIGKAHFQQLRSTPEFPSIESHPLLRDLNYWRNFHGPWYGIGHVELARCHGDEALVGQHYALWMEEKGFFGWRAHFQTNWEEFDYSDGHPNPPQKHKWSLPEEFHTNAWITERSLERIRRNKEEGKPFFLWASYFDPHPPYLVPEPWASMYDPAKITVPCVVSGEHEKSPSHIQKTQQEHPDFTDLQESCPWNHGCHSHLHGHDALAKDIAVYYGMISMMDHYIGKLLDGLESAGLADNTLVVFTSDHGHYYGHHGLTAKGPFHYEDGIRVPFIVRWPERVPAGVESDSLQSLIDVPVSFLRVANVPVPSFMQGINQLPVWCGGKKTVRKNVLIEHRHQPTAIHMKTYVDDRYKLTVYFERDYGELFDLQNDPQEIKNLWDEPASEALKLELTRKLLFAEMAVEPMPMPRVSIA
ncbi:MAG: sulfatase-like hydrolase/transferase [Kiritimatiellales bacterium]